MVTRPVGVSKGIGHFEREITMVPIQTRLNIMRTWLDPLTRNERAASLVEYALLIALIATVCIGAVFVLGGTVGDEFDSFNDEFEQVQQAP